MILLGGAFLAACSGSPAPTGEVGAACSGDKSCKSGTCLVDAGFPDNYCSRDCSTDATCPEGASCEDYLGSQLCLLACAGDEDCRTGYVCDYGSCRPLCADDTVCRGTDVCSLGHCRAPCQRDADCAPGRCDKGRCLLSCQADGDCPPDKLCQAGTCLPPCTADTECQRGYVCNLDSGHCDPRPGRALGAPCATSAECSTEYCLPTRKVCSFKCSASGQCPASFVCGLEKVDADGNGRFEQAEADCVPVKGSGAAGTLCAKEDDCASGHCYDGFCMESCAGDTDCGKNQCLDVHVILDGGAPSYKGCLPRQGVGNNVVGVYDGRGSYQSIDIPPNAQSFVLSAEIASSRITDMPIIHQLKDPDGIALSGAYDYCSMYSAPLRYMPAEQYTSVFLPNTSTVTLKPGRYTFAVASTELSQKVTLRLQLKLGKADKGTLNINWFFLDLTPGWGFCVPGARLNAASAPAHPWFTKARNNMAAIFKNAGLSLGQETFHDLSNAALDTIELDTTGGVELQKLFASSQGMTGSSVNIFFVRGIHVSGMGGGTILGISGGIPGPLGVHGLVHSGVALSTETACFESYGVSTGQVLAHELGHYLGLYHNEESDEFPGFDSSSGTVICPCPCGKNLTCQSGSGKSWCRGEDPLPDTDKSPQNLMYFSADESQTFQGNTLTPGQIRVLLDNPLVGH